MFGSDQELPWRDEKEAGSEREMMRVAQRTVLAEALSWIKEFVQDHISQHKCMDSVLSRASNQRDKKFDGSKDGRS